MTNAMIARGCGVMPARRGGGLRRCGGGLFRAALLLVWPALFLSPLAALVLSGWLGVL